MMIMIMMIMMCSCRMISSLSAILCAKSRPLRNFANVQNLCIAISDICVITQHFDGCAEFE